MKDTRVGFAFRLQLRSKLVSKIPTKKVVDCLLFLLIFQLVTVVNMSDIVVLYRRFQIFCANLAYPIGPWCLTGS